MLSGSFSVTEHSARFSFCSFFLTDRNIHTVGAVINLVYKYVELKASDEHTDALLLLKQQNRVCNTKTKKKTTFFYTRLRPRPTVQDQHQN